MVICQKLSSQGRSSYSYSVHPGNKWKPVESLKVRSLREEPAEKKMGEGGGDAARKTG